MYFVNHARSILDGKWMGDYGNLTLIKGPFYPMFIALSAEFGLPLHVAETLLYGVACVVGVLAVASVVRSGISRVVLFLVLFFNPMTFEASTSRVMRGDISGSLVLLVFAVAIWLFFNRERATRELILASLTLGGVLSAFLLTREEGIWIYCFLAFIGIAMLVGSADRTRAAVLKRSIPVAIVAAVVIGSYGVVATENLIRYGWFTTVEVTTPEFASAYGALARIVPAAASDPRVPVSMSALEAAYRVSPAALEMAPYFRGHAGRDAIRGSCETFGICSGIGGGWFLWVFRDAVAAAGHYSDGKNARGFYQLLASEIDHACSTHELRCTSNRRTLSPKIPLSLVPQIASDMVRAFEMVVNFSYLSFDDPGPLRPDQAVPEVFRSATGDKLSVDGGFSSDHALKLDWQRRIGAIYQALAPVMVIFATIVLLLRVRTSASERRLDAVALIAIFVTVGSAAFLTLLTIVNDVSFPVLSTEYMRPLYAATLFGATFTLTADPQYWTRSWLWLPRLREKIEGAPGYGHIVRKLGLARRAVISYAVAGAAASAAAFAVALYVFHSLGSAGTGRLSAGPAVAFTSQAAVKQQSKSQLDDGQLAKLPRLFPIALTASIDGALLLSDGKWIAQPLASLTVTKGTPLLFVGWAADPRRLSTAAGLMAIVDSKERVNATAGYGGDRPDVAKAFGRRAMLETAFSASLPTSSLSVGRHVLTLGIISADGRGFYPSKTAVSFVVK
jgi:hypothetical protein